MSSPKSQTSRILQINAEEFLPSPHSLMVAGGWAALLALAGFLAGACVLPYTAKVKAAAMVRPSEGASEQGFMLRAWIPNASINQVQLGQPVQVRLEACPYPDYGILHGAVEAIASDVVPPDPTVFPSLSRGIAPTGSYEVTIQASANQLQNQGKRCPLRAGMEGRADIQIGRETMLSLLLRQLH